jgi:hypothetical protein
MRKLNIGAASVVGLLAVAGLVLASEALVSGPQVGDKVPGPFHPLNINGEKAGQKNCLYCQNGTNPVVMIFAREASEPLTTLIKKVDAATAQHEDAHMGSFVVFLSESKELPDQLKEMADKEGLKKCVLSVMEPQGPKPYKVSPEADVTVVLYTNHEVKANYAFPKGGLKEENIDKILSDVSKILPQG